MTLEFDDILDAPVETDLSKPPLPDPYSNAPLWEGNQDEIEGLGGFEDQLVKSLGKDYGKTTKECLAFIRKQNTSGSRSWYRMCLSLARQSRGLPGVYPDAQTAWSAAIDKHPTRTNVFRNVPRGAPLFYKGGTWGHVATYAGRTKDQVHICWSNDAKVRGGVSLVPIDFFEKHWGYPLLGWTGDLNGYNLKLSDIDRPQGAPLPRPDKDDPKKPKPIHEDRLDRLKDWRRGLQDGAHDARSNNQDRRLKVLQFRLKVINNLIERERDKKK